MDYNPSTSLDVFTPNPRNILLINTHAIDIRLPWSGWHQPTGLLQIGASLRKRGCDVRLLDCLGQDVSGLIRRRKVGELDIEGYSINLWRFGRLWHQLDEEILSFKQEGWEPKQIYVSCGQTTWWKAAKLIIDRIKNDWFPEAEIFLGGNYPSLRPQHARNNTKADRIIPGSISDVNKEIPAFDLYPKKLQPNFAGLYLYHSKNITDINFNETIVLRDPAEIAKEYDEKASIGANEFAFFDDEIRVEHRAHYIDVLKAISAVDRDNASLVSVGNISPNLITKDVAIWMAKAGYKKVALKCDVSLSNETIEYLTPFNIYDECVNALLNHAKFKPRKGNITAMMLVGHPFEDMADVTERLIQLSSIIGSVNLIQYQYSKYSNVNELLSDTVKKRIMNLSLSELNPKLYPISRFEGKKYKDYIELTRLSALLNSKYRGKTFNFLGSGIVPKLFQKSVNNESWNPYIDS